MSSPDHLVQQARPAFVGREAELTTLRGELSLALEGQARLVLIEGEPGIGKTRVAEELATAARAHGAVICWGRCWEGDGTPAFWPWVQVIRAYVRERDPQAVRAEMGTGAADIAQMVPEVSERLPGLPVPPALEATQARFRFFDSVSTFLKNAAAERPLLLILDDLHWADPPSLRLLHFLARDCAAARLLIVGTYRHVELANTQPLAAVLGELARASCCLRLSGLGRAAVRQFVERMIGSAATEEFVTRLHERTDGNPFFVHEVLRLLLVPTGPTTGGADPMLVAGVPQSVRQTVRQRLSQLSEATRRALSVAAVLGQDVSVPLLVRMTDPANDRAILDAVDEAHAADIVDRAAGTEARFRFRHALIRETLYEDLPTAERLLLHQRAGEAIVDLYAAQVEPHLAEIAHHFLSASSEDTADRAVRYGIRAARQAIDGFAFEEAVQLCRRLLPALPPGGRRRERRRCGLLLFLSEAQFRAGEESAATESCEAAAETARRAGLGRYLARAAVQRARRLIVGGSDATVIRLLEEGRRELDERDCALRARLLGKLAAALSPYDSGERRQSLCEVSIAVARRVGDRVALAQVLESKHWTIWEPDNVNLRLALATEIVAIGRETHQYDLTISGHELRIVDLLEIGDRTAADREIEIHSRLAEQARDHLARWHTLTHRALQALLGGRFDDAETLTYDALASGQRLGGATALQYFGAQIFALRWEQGRLQELEGSATALAQVHGANAGWRAGIAFLHAEHGQEGPARAELERLAAHDFADLPRDFNWLIALAFLSQVCADLQDRPRAATLYGLLLPYAQRNVVVAPGIVCTGSVAHNLGVLASCLRRWPLAERHFEDAIAMNQRLGARPFIAHSQREYGAMLLQRQEPGDAERAAILLAHADATYQELRMESFRQQVSALQADKTPPPESALGTAATPIVVRENVFRREGDYWTIAYGAKVIRLSDSRGLRYLSFLLRHPGTDFHVADLMQASVGPLDDSAAPIYRAMNDEQLAAENLSVVRHEASGEGPDSHAQQEYRRRLRELSEPTGGSLSNAESDDAVEESETERAALLAELHPRGSGHAQQTDAVEKQRKAVGNRIRATMMRVQDEHTALWRHLSASIKTGTWCSYQPEQPTHWTFEVPPATPNVPA